MTYIDIIQDNVKNHSKVLWWPKFAYHYTDVTNAVSILSTGTLYSRHDATALKIMSNDNASRQVIDVTNQDITSMVRLYFRPLTPTQYYNEGYKHQALRYYRDERANVPVPIFFLFDLNKLLSLPGVKFSEKSQAGHGSLLHSGVDEFAKLNFDFIYDNSYERINETKDYRHAEIVCPASLPVEPYIRKILCRNSQDRSTLLNLLIESSPNAFQKYQNIIKEYRNDVFENNGIFISKCLYYKDKICIEFSDTYESQRYIDRMMQKNNVTELSPIRVGISVTWYKNNAILNQAYVDTLYDPRGRGRELILKGFKTPSQSDKIGIKIHFDDKLVCYAVQSTGFSELLF